MSKIVSAPVAIPPLAAAATNQHSVVIALPQDGSMPFLHSHDLVVPALQNLQINSTSNSAIIVHLELCSGKALEALKQKFFDHLLSFVSRPPIPPAKHSDPSVNKTAETPRNTTGDREKSRSSVSVVVGGIARSVVLLRACSVTPDSVATLLRCHG